MIEILKSTCKNDVKQIESLQKIKSIVELVLRFNEERQKQLRGRLKILPPSQILSRLPISLAQLKAGNNSKKLKNEIRQLLYFLYISKKLTKKIYTSLTDII